MMVFVPDTPRRHVMARRMGTAVPSLGSGKMAHLEGWLRWLSKIGKVTNAAIVDRLRNTAEVDVSLTTGHARSEELPREIRDVVVCFSFWLCRCCWCFGL